MNLKDTLSIGQTVQFTRLPQGVASLPEARIEQVDEAMAYVIFTSGEFDLDPRVLRRSEITMAWSHRGRTQECPVVVEQVQSSAMWLRARVGERRELLRIQTPLALLYEVIAPEDLAGIVEGILSGSPSREDLEIEVDRLWRSDDLGERIDEQFSQLTRYINQLDAKLDYLIALGEGRTPAPSPVTHSVTLFDISGAGLSFLSEEPLAVGAYLKLAIQLSRFPLSEIVAAGRVIRCVESARAEEGKRLNIGVEFEAIHEDDREKIFRFISRVERKLLRERKELLNP